MLTFEAKMKVLWQCAPYPFVTGNIQADWEETVIKFLRL